MCKYHEMAKETEINVLINVNLPHSFGTSVKDQGSHDLASEYGTQGLS
jgi:hypothetical protein